MKYFFLIILSNIFFSCSNPLEKQYDKFSLEKDITKIENVISENELNELLEYILVSVSLGVDINGKTYNELLNDIRIAKNNEKKQKIFFKQNIEELVNQRLENDLCDEFLLEKNKKDKHKHDSKMEWDDDSFLIEY